MGVWSGINTSSDAKHNYSFKHAQTDKQVIETNTLSKSAIFCVFLECQNVDRFYLSGFYFFQQRNYVVRTCSLSGTDCNFPNWIMKIALHR